MDTVYGSYNANATSAINIGEYFRQYKQLIDSMRNDCEFKLDDKQCEELAQNCSINNIQAEDLFIPPVNRIAMKKAPPKVPSNVNLQTLTRLEEKYSNDPRMFRPALKYRNETTVNYSQPTQTGPQAVPGEDVLVFIRVYHPFGCHNYEPPRKRLSIVLHHVIVMLGHQTLSQLRDKIECISDLSSTIESSENPTEYLGENNKDVYKSSFFYIGDSFYNDTRHADCKDNSEPILKWAKTKKLGPFKTESMENVRIDSLCIKFGYPWVFQHQGNCEHLITFSDARLVDLSDHLAVSNYPRVSRARPVKHPYCLMCIEKPVHWVVIGNDRLPHDPCHFCHQCFIRYNYVDGKKIGTFRAYRYPRDARILNWINDKKLHLQPL